MLAEDVHSLSQYGIKLGGADGSKRWGRYPRFELVHELEQFLGEGGLIAVEHEAFRSERARQCLQDHWDRTTEGITR